MFLPFCPGVFGASVAVQPSFLADAYGVCVESLGMCPGPFHRSGSDDLPVLAYVEVIARSFESPSSVTLLQVMLREAAVFSGCGAVNNNQIDFSHSSGSIFRCSPRGETSGMPVDIPVFFVFSSLFLLY